MKLNFKQILLGIITPLMLSSCASVYDFSYPAAEEKRRQVSIKTFNYRNLKIETEGHELYASKGGFNAGRINKENITGDAGIQTNGRAIFVSKKDRKSKGVANIFGEFSGFIKTDKTATIGIEFSKEDLKGFSFAALPITISADNFKDKKVEIKKRIRYLWAFLDVYPGFGIPLLLENGHLWKLKNRLKIELEPNELYSEFCELLSDNLNRKDIDFNSIYLVSGKGEKHTSKRYMKPSKITEYELKLLKAILLKEDNGVVYFSSKKEAESESEKRNFNYFMNEVVTCQYGAKIIRSKAFVKFDNRIKQCSQIESKDYSSFKERDLIYFSTAENLDKRVLEIRKEKQEKANRAANRSAYKAANPSCNCYKNGGRPNSSSREFEVAYFSHCFKHCKGCFICR